MSRRSKIMDIVTTDYLQARLEYSTNPTNDNLIAYKKAVDEFHHYHSLLNETNS